ncbi:MAG: PepSY domain-containing protein [Acidobacteria bacterium]|nr:PepSY domain-containing protein [Acidobacteriota bacterium]
MKFNVLNRRVHHWAAAAVALPMAVVIVTGLLLQVKKQVAWVQPAEYRGSGLHPDLSFADLLDRVQAIEGLGVSGWADVQRLDVRPDRGVAKIILRNRWEVQVDLGTGDILQTAYRRSDLIESLHDGSFFGGDWVKLGVFLPTGLVFLLMWLTGLRMFWVPFMAKRRRAAVPVEQERRAA